MLVDVRQQMQKLDDDDVFNDECEVTRMLEQEAGECKTDLGDACEVTRMNEEEVAERKPDLGDDYNMTNKIEEQEGVECKKDADLCDYARLEQMKSTWNKMKQIGQGRSLMEWICALKRKEGECKLRWAVITARVSVAISTLYFATES